MKVPRLLTHLAKHFSFSLDVFIFRFAHRASHPLFSSLETLVPVPIPVPRPRLWIRFFAELSFLHFALPLCYAFAYTSMQTLATLVYVQPRSVTFG